MEQLTVPMAPSLTTSSRSRADARYTKNDFMREFFQVKMSNYQSPKLVKPPKFATAMRSLKRNDSMPIEQTKKPQIEDFEEMKGYPY